MKKHYLLISFFVLSLVLLCSTERASAFTIHTIGDSTMEYKDPAVTESGQRGWAQMLDLFVVNGVTINNRAKSGTSSMTFYEQEDASGNKRFWATVKPQINAGDYVLIQFGHNDEKHNGEEGEIGTNPWQSYTMYLKKYVTEVRELGATPVLLTPIVRNQFSNGKITDKGAHNLGMGTDSKELDYPGAMKAVAEELNCLLVDHTALTKGICEQYGPTKVSELIYNVGDGTHIGEYGAILYARLAVQDMIRQNILSEYFNADPELMVSPSSYDFGKCHMNTVAVYPFSVSGIDLVPAEGEVAVSVSNGFLISKEQNKNFSQTLNLSYINGNLAMTTIYVRYAPKMVGLMTGAITFTYGDGSTKQIELKGECVSFEGGQNAGVYWELSKDESYVSEGPISIIPEVFSKMYVGRYAAPGSTTTWEDGKVDSATKTQRNIIEGDNWPAGEIDIVHDRYIQFGVTAVKGTVFNVDSIGLYVGGSGTNNMRFRVLCSKDQTFSDPIMIADRQTNTTNTMYPVSHSSIIEVAGEESLYLRVYPWLNNGGSSKSICLYGVTIKGIVTEQTETGNETIEISNGKSAYCTPAITGGSTILNYTLHSGSSASINVYSLRGESLVQIQVPAQNAGTYQQMIDLSQFPSGVYLCSVLSGTEKTVARVIKR